MKFYDAAIEQGSDYTEMQDGEANARKSYHVFGWDLHIESAWDAAQELWIIQSIELRDIPNNKVGWVLAHMVEPIDAVLLELSKKHGFDYVENDDDIVWKGHTDYLRGES